MLEDNAKMLRALNALPPDDADARYLKFVIKRGEEQSNTTRLFLQMSIAGSAEQSLRALCEQTPDDMELQKKHQEALEHYQRFEAEYVAYTSNRSHQQRIEDLEAELTIVTEQRGHYCRKLGPVCRALTYLLSYFETLPNSDIDPTTREELMKDGYSALQGKPFDL